MTGWRPTKLGELLTKSDEWIDLKPDATYRQVTVRLWGKGVVRRGEITGAEIAASRQCVVHARQFIASRIDARNGAFGLIPDSLEGAIVTSDFPVFSLNETRMLPEYLHWLSKTGSFVELCKAASEGTTNRVRLKEDRFLALEIPLPAVTEQRRIVARIEQLTAQIEEAHRLRHQATEETDALLPSALNRTAAEAAKKFDTKPMREVASTANGFGFPKHLQGATDLPYPFAKCSDMNLPGNERYIERAQNTVNDALVQQMKARVYPKGTLIFPKIGGAIATNKRRTLSTPGTFDNNVMGLVPSAQLSPEWLYYFMSSVDLTELQAGTSVPAVKQSKVEELEIPVPPLPEQRRLVAYLDGLAGQVARLARLQTETAAELDALLPSILAKAFKGEL